MRSGLAGVLACEAMRTGAATVTIAMRRWARIVRFAAASAVLGGLLLQGCTHAGGKIPVDNSKLLTYEAPDIDELTGVDSSEQDEPAAEPDAKSDAKDAAKGAAQKPQT